LSIHQQHASINQAMQSHLAELNRPGLRFTGSTSIATVEQIKNQQTVGQKPLLIKPIKSMPKLKKFRN